MLERRSAISNILTLASHQHHQSDSTVCLSERRPLTVLQISAFASTIEHAQACLAEALALPLPAPNHFSGDQHINLKNIAPGVWLLVTTADAGPGIEILRPALNAVATVVDLSHARTALHLSGLSATKTLAKFCGLDLAPSIFKTGCSTNTRFGHIGMTISRIDDVPSFELLVFRGYAQHVCESLVQAAAEFGLTVIAEQRP